jgi:DNA polymerase III subunit gamma/tau
MDEHQALYRRYRPQTPAEVLGQDHVVRALTGAIREGRLAHAFLFCGPRGTGKTSTARILAKMVNCEKGPTAEPCGTCEQCVAIREGTHVDVVEIDAASHGGVEDARDLREKAPTAPMSGREKVYIIDEAQRLSREAFDALLKLFEEPPPGVRFVLATTEPHKMPATIVGRCQRFDFRRLPVEQLADHLQMIAEQEGITIEMSAAQTIARQAEGSARDALSLLDQAGVLGGRKVGDEEINALLGAPRGEVRAELADAIAVGDAKTAFEVVGRLVQEGQDLRNVTNECLIHFRDLLLVRAAPGQEDLLDIPSDGYEPLRKQAARFSEAELARVIDLFMAAQSDMRWTTSPRLTLELALVRAAMPQTDPNPAALIARLERLERLANLDVAAGDASAADVVTRPKAAPKQEAPPVKRSAGSSPRVKAVSVPEAEAPDKASAEPKSEPDAVAPKPVAADAGNVDVTMLRRSWSTVLEHLASSGKRVLPTFLERATVVAFDGSTLELAFAPDSRLAIQKVEERQEQLVEALEEMFGIRPKIVCAQRTSSAPVVDEAEEPDDAEALRRVQEMLGAKVSGEVSTDV